MKRLLILLLLCCGAPRVGASEPPQCLFQFYTTFDGLTHDRIADIYTDSRGFVWVCTWYGVSRFDGYAFRNFNAVPGDFSPLSHHRFVSVSEDANGHLWFTTYNLHVYRFNRFTEQFEDVAALIEGFDAKHYRTTHCLHDREGGTWVAIAGQGVVRFAGRADASPVRVDALLETYPNVVYLKSTPTPEDDTPVKLNNGWFSRIFELVGDMYARPKYGTLDLTPFFAPFYMLFFGICLNDAGYGLILLAAGIAMLAKVREPMMRRAAWFATMCALSTTLFGLFCGSFFGMSLAEYFPSIPFFDFQGEFFSIALAIGMVQILFGLVLNIWTTVRSFGWKYAFGTLGWFIILLSGSLAAGLPMLAEGWAIPGFTASSPAFYGALGGGALFMLLLNTPGRNPLVNIGSGLWDLYNNLTGLLSDVLSYIRLFAIGLSGGVLALVFNSLASGFVPEGANIVVRLLVMIPILLIGHGINLFMSTISSFVHPMRLTFVEFYKNAGFEMASRSFDPIRKMNRENE